MANAVLPEPCIKQSFARLILDHRRRDVIYRTAEPFADLQLQTDKLSADSVRRIVANFGSPPTSRFVQLASAPYLNVSMGSNNEINVGKIITDFMCNGTACESFNFIFIYYSFFVLVCYTRNCGQTQTLTTIASVISFDSHGDGLTKYCNNMNCEWTFTLGVNAIASGAIGV